MKDKIHSPVEWYIKARNRISEIGFGVFSITRKRLDSAVHTVGVNNVEKSILECERNTVIYYLIFIIQQIDCRRSCQA